MQYLLIALVLIVVGYLAASLLREFVHGFKQINGALYFGSYWALALAVGGTILCWQCAQVNHTGATPSEVDWRLFTLFLLSGITGAVCGAGLGIFFFPLSAQEQAQFTQIRS